MKQYQFARGYQTLCRFASSITLPARTAYDVFVMKKKMEPIYMARVDAERSLLESCDGQIGNDGFPVFKSESGADNYRKQLIELNDIDVDEKIKPIEVSFDMLNGQTLLPSDIEDLDGFISFR